MSGLFSAVPVSVAIVGGTIPSPICRCFNGRATMACTAVCWGSGGDWEAVVSIDKSSDRGITVSDEEDGSRRSVNDTIPSGWTLSVRICMNMYPNNNIAKQNTAPDTRPRMNEPPAERSVVAVA